MELPVVTDEMMRSRLGGTREYTIVVLHRAPAYATRSDVESIVWEHGRRNFALRAAGLLSIVCPVRDDSDVAGVGIYNADPAQTCEILRGDPGVQAGIFTYEVHPCRAFPGDCLPAERRG